MAVILNDEPVLLTCEQLSAKIQVTPQVVRKLANDGKIPCFRINSKWRFSLSDVLKSFERPAAN